MYAGFSCANPWGVPFSPFQVRPGCTLQKPALRYITPSAQPNNTRDIGYLRQFKIALGNPAILSSWESEMPCGSPNWEGVVCDQDGHLVTLNLTGMGLSGRITPEVVDALSSLGTVQVIDLSGNRLFGSLPDVYGTNSSLRVLDLSLNQLTGRLPATWRVMGSLEVLDLSQNAWQVSLIFTRVQGPALLQLELHCLGQIVCAVMAYAWCTIKSDPLMSAPASTVISQAVVDSFPPHAGGSSK